MTTDKTETNENENVESSKKNEKFEWIKSIIIAIIIAFAIKFFLFDFVVVEGSSMFPTLHDGNRVLLNKIEYAISSPDYNDIVVLKMSKNVDYVKRVIGKAGDTIEIKNQIVYRNGKELEEDYINPEPYNDFDKVTVPEGCYFVMGDNRSNSKDSRYESVGFIEEERIIGHVIFRIWPFKDAGKVQ